MQRYRSGQPADTAGSMAMANRYVDPSGGSAPSGCVQPAKLSDCGLKAPACRIWYVNLRSAAPVAAGATVTLSANIQEVFQAWNMVFPSSIAPFFEWSTLKVGTRDQEVALSQPMLCDTQSEVAYRGMLILDPTFVGKDISVTMTNIDAVPHSAYVQFTGFAVGG
mgnify:CR=1 FL=1